MELAQHASVALGDNVPVVYVNFCGNYVPPYAWRYGSQIDDKLVQGPSVTNSGTSAGTGNLAWNSRPNKVVKTPPPGNTCIDGLSNGLLAAGYHLVFVGTRFTEQVGGPTRRVVQYIFGRTPPEDPNRGEMMEQMLSELREEEKGFLFNAVVFLNPRYFTGSVVEGQHTVSINCNAPEARFTDDKAPRKVWVRNEFRQKLGEAPFLLLPMHSLRIVDDSVVCSRNKEEEVQRAEKAALLASSRTAAQTSA